jgi:hypothetical protein
MHTQANDSLPSSQMRATLFLEKKKKRIDLNEACVAIAISSRDFPGSFGQPAAR